MSSSSDEPIDLILSDVHMQCSCSGGDVSSPATVVQLKGLGPDVPYSVHRTRFEFRVVVDVNKRVEDDVCSSQTDDDGDLCVSRCKKSLALNIVHTSATKLSHVGCQVWPGALLLCDYVLANADDFQDRTVLDCGAGVGVSSVVLATVGAKVVATDIDLDALDFARRNISENKDVLPETCEITVRQLDWTQIDGASDWLPDLMSNLDVIVAADVVYNVDAGKALFALIETSARVSSRDLIVILTVEQRINFCLPQLTAECTAYDHFMDWLDSLHNNPEFIMHINQIDYDKFTQTNFCYERNPFMELWIVKFERTNKNKF